MKTALRPAAVAGRFYPRKAETLAAEIESFVVSGGRDVRALGCVVPHAGYIYSGAVAGAVFGLLDLPSRYVILCPNHTGLGCPLSIMSDGAWETPLGEAQIDSHLAHALKQQFPLLMEDVEAHRSEHAIEVQLPFLQVLRPEFSFVPITVGTIEFDVLAALGFAIAEAVASEAGQVLIIASSDMNHYESDPITRAKDEKAIQQMLARNARGLFDVVTKQKISMCGIGPAVAMLNATQQLGSRSAELVQYATSGDVSGDRRMVVGYAGIVVE